MSDVKKEYSLKKPSLLKRVWKVWLYNIILSAIFFHLFWGFFTIKQLCWELDYFLMETESIFDIRKELIAICIAFWFMFRQTMKDINLIKFTYLTSKHDKEIVDQGGYKRIYEGPEGSCKTLNVANDTLFLACDQDRKFRLNYYLKYPFREALKDDIDFKVMQASYDYYEAHSDKIPHLMANFKLKYDNREQYDFDMAYLDEKKRIAEGFVVGFTEIANHLPNSWGKMPADEEKDKFNRITKNKFLSTSRQSTALKIVADEQRTGEVWIGFRSVTSSNRLITSSKKVLAPHFLERVQESLENVVLKLGKNNSKFISKLYVNLSELIQDIGFYKIVYADKEAIKDNVNKEGFVFVISCDIPFEYDTRGERFKYKLYGQNPS